MKKDPSKQVKGEWHHFDAKGKVLGRLATEVASLLLGKHRLDFAPHKISPVFVVITNTDEVAVTGDKEKQKMYYHYSGYPGGLSERSLREQRQRDSRRIISAAVGGMLPKNSLRDKRLQHLKLYRGAEHPHLAQIAS